MLLKRTRLLEAARLAGSLRSTTGRSVVRREMNAAAEFDRAFAPGFAGRLQRLQKDKTVLVWGAAQIGEVIGQLPLLLAFQAAGYRPVILAESRQLIVRRAYRRIGCDRVIYLEDFLASGPHPEGDPLARSVRGADELLALEYKGTRSGKFALSTLMRFTRQGDPELDGEGTREMLAGFLSAAFHAADAIESICDAVAPDACLLNERGYSPYGQLFDAVLAKGGFAVTWNAAHRNDALILKRYHRGNIDQNHFSLSAASWQQLLSMPWSDAKWERVRGQVLAAYRSGEWFSECATQVQKTFPEREELVARLGLGRGRKVGAIFPHMFWDATFFWGVDIFRNYEDWFIEALRAAAANRDMDWIVKIHPANVAKNRRDNYVGEQSEITAIRKALGTLPDHIKLIEADSDISTASLFALMDACLTVRGTIGIEAACLGTRVLTAGTGRYDRLGFTTDPATPEEFRETVARLHEMHPPSAEQTELARRFAYGVFIARPLSLTSTSFGYAPTASAPLKTSVRLSPGVDPLAAADVVHLTQWLLSGADDFLDLATLQAEDDMPCAAS